MMKLKKSGQAVFLAGNEIYRPDRGTCTTGYIDVVIAGTKRIERVRTDSISTKEEQK